MNLGVDVYVREITPPRYRPGLGLRPGRERQDIEPLVPLFYSALYETIGAHSRLGLNVVADVGHHDAYSIRHRILNRCAQRLDGLPVLFVGVHCAIETIMERRNQGQSGRDNQYAVGSAHDPVPKPVLAWQQEVHVPGIYDLEVDTSSTSAEHCAAAIRQRLLEEHAGPSAFERLASLISD
jgi:chloramphenicol 3-O phosphotransferase